MKTRNGIIAAWMSPDRLFEFTACNQLANLVLLAVMYLLKLFQKTQNAGTYFMISKEVETYFAYLFKGYGAFVAILGIFLVILSAIGKLGGIDGKRIFHLFVLGIVNIVEAVYFMMEVFV